MMIGMRRRETPALGHLQISPEIDDQRIRQLFEGFVNVSEAMSH